MGIIKNILKRGVKDVTDPKKIKAYLVFKLMKLIIYLEGQGGKTLFRPIRKDEFEQIIKRASTCNECYKKGSCIKCECDVWAKMLDPKDECPQKSWLAMKPAHIWKRGATKRNFEFNYNED